MIKTMAAIQWTDFKSQIAGCRVDERKGFFHNRNDNKVGKLVSLRGFRAFPEVL